MTAKIRKRKRRIDSKYRPKFARELREGLRTDGKSKAECCQHWGITIDNYNQYLQTEPKFKEAHEIGETDWQAWWWRTYRLGASGAKPFVDAGLLKHASKTILGLVDKVEVKQETPPPVRKITINILSAPKELPKIIDAEKVENAKLPRSEHITDAESS